MVFLPKISSDITGCVICRKIIKMISMLALTDRTLLILGGSVHHVPATEKIWEIVQSQVAKIADFVHSCSDGISHS